MKQVRRFFRADRFISAAVQKPVQFIYRKGKEVEKEIETLIWSSHILYMLYIFHKYSTCHFDFIFLRTLRLDRPRWIAAIDPLLIVVLNNLYFRWEI